MYLLEERSLFEWAVYTCFLLDGAVHKGAILIGLDSVTTGKDVTKTLGRRTISTSGDTIENNGRGKRVPNCYTIFNVMIPQLIY